MRLPNNPWHGGYCEEPLDGQIDVREAVDECSYRRADSIRDRRPTADHRMGIHPQPANVDLSVYGDLAVGRVLILNNPHAVPRAPTHQCPLSRVFTLFFFANGPISVNRLGG